MKVNNFFRLLSGVVLLVVIVIGPLHGQSVDAKIDAFRRLGNMEGMVDLFRHMPKGGDIHTHLTGAVSSALYWQMACDADWFVNTATGKASSRSDGTSQSIKVKANPMLRNEVLKKWSILGYMYQDGDQRKQAVHFFDAFKWFGDLAGTDTRRLLRVLKDSAVNDHIQYLELMAFSPKVADGLNGIFPSHGVGESDIVKFEQNLKALLGNKAYQDSTDKWAVKYAADTRLLETETRNDRVVCRYQGYTNRNSEDLLKVFTQLCVSFKACMKDSLLVGVNIVSEESAPVAVNNYDKHMRMFKVLKEKYRDKVKTSLHAGELVKDVITSELTDKVGAPDKLREHIRKAVEVAYADRIGHGIDINQLYGTTPFESDTSALSDAMKRTNPYRTGPVVVEVNLSSNEFILGVKGPAHCLNFYKRNEVPFVIATDDQGILCTTLSEQYAKLAMEHGYNYREIKELVYNSVRYSFASLGMKACMKGKLDKAFQEFEHSVK